ncbi:MAG: DNA internalization-related competence protein ComEC/Rec2 [Planctomycetes bacterium]|nr:DNA internalization-related competence protein ComEC/Rec2 [Planctomycetota bacterium]
MHRFVEYARARPLTVAAPALIVGIVVSSQTHVPWPWTAAIGVSGAALVTVSILLRRGASVGVFFLGFALGFVRQEIAEFVPATDVSRATLPEGRVRVRGIVLERPRLYRERAVALEETTERHDERASGSFPMEIVGIDGMPGVTGRVRVQFYDREVRLIGGEEVAVGGKLRHPRPQSNPGGADPRAILAREGIGAILVVGARDEWRVVNGPSLVDVGAAIEQARDGVRGTFYRHARPDAAALLSALVIGSRENLPEELVESLQKSGTAHFLAISGQNLAIVLLLVAGALTLAGVRGRPQHGIVILVLFVYTALSGWQVSVVRAFLMVVLWLGAYLVWRRADSVNALSAAALGIALVDPTQVFLPGFQLSFLAVLGILLVTPIFHDVAAVGGNRVVRWARGVLAISLAAWLATAPIVLSNFHFVTPIILVANLTLVPLMLLEVALGVTLFVVAPIAGPLADALGWTAGVTLDAIAGASALLTRLPGSFAFSPALPGWALASYYVALTGWTAWARAKPEGVRPWCCALLAVWLAIPAFVRERPEGFFVAMVDVGRGSAVYAEWPDGRNLVFDCGSLNHRDVGATVVAPYLWSRGIRRVDTLVLSHADADHINGARSLIERMGVRRIVVPRGFAAELPSGIDVVRVERAGREPVRFAPGIEVFGPPVWAKFGGETAANDTSIVMRLEGRVLVTGDIEERGTEELLTFGDALGTEVLMLPHHGKRQDLHEALAAAVRPRIALVSAPEGYSAAEVVEPLREKCEVYTTGRHGCVEICFGPEGARVETFLGR